MRRPRKRNRGAAEDRKKQVALFLAGVAVGLLFFIFYRFTAPPRPVHVEKTAERREPALPAVAAAPRVVTPRAPKPRIAVVLDDFGYNLNNVDAILNIKIPVTFSILPQRTYSRRIAERVRQNAYEAILHLPLEAHEENKLVKKEPSTITTKMKKNEVLSRLAKALDDVPGATGVSNHQGSKATEAPLLMGMIFAELAKRKLYFLDSVSTGKSVCKKVAAEAGIRYGQRSVFLDNKGDFDYINGQMQLLVKKARRSGSAVGIGHDRPHTVEVLARLLPAAQDEGIEFVFLSDLIR